MPIAVKMIFQISRALALFHDRKLVVSNLSPFSIYVQNSGLNLVDNTTCYVDCFDCVNKGEKYQESDDFPKYWSRQKGKTVFDKKDDYLYNPKEDSWALGLLSVLILIIGGKQQIIESFTGLLPSEQVAQTYDTKSMNRLIIMLKQSVTTHRPEQFINLQQQKKSDRQKMRHKEFFDQIFNGLLAVDNNKRLQVLKFLRFLKKWSDCDFEQVRDLFFESQLLNEEVLIGVQEKLLGQCWQGKQELKEQEYEYQDEITSFEAYSDDDEQQSMQLQQSKGERQKKQKITRSNVIFNSIIASQLKDNQDQDLQFQIHCLCQQSALDRMCNNNIQAQQLTDSQIVIQYEIPAFQPTENQNLLPIVDQKSQSIYIYNIQQQKSFKFKLSKASSKLRKVPSSASIFNSFITGDLYMLGGFCYDYDQIRKNVRAIKINLKSKRSIPLNNLPYQCVCATGCCINSYTFVLVGGIKVGNQELMYDQKQRRWSFLPVLCSRRKNPAVLAIENFEQKEYIYVFGGETQEGGNLLHTNYSQNIERIANGYHRWQELRFINSGQFMDSLKLTKCFAIPLNDKKILIFGGKRTKKQRSCESIVLDIQKKLIEQVNTLPSGVVDRAILYPLGAYGERFFYFGTKLSVRQRNTPLVGRFNFPQNLENFNVSGRDFITISDSK